MKKVLRNQNGSGLAMSLIILAVFSLLAVTIYSGMQAMMRESVYELRLAQAQAIAEADMEEALLQLRLTPAWRSGFTKKSFAGGSYTVTLSSAVPPLVTSQGTSALIAILGSAHAALQAQSLLTESYCTTFTGNNATINGYIDTYDSALSTAPASFGSGGHFCSNNKFTLKDQGTISVHMDVDFFTNPVPDSTLIEGTVTKSTFTYTLPVHDGTPFVTSNSNAQLSSTFYTAATKSLVIPVNTTALMPPGTYYLNTLTVTGNLQVNNSTAAAIIYLNTDFTLPNHANVHNGEITNVSGIPSRLLIYPQGSRTISLQSKASVVVILDGAASNLTIGTTVYGNLVGNNITIQNPNIFHFDLETAPSALPARAAWQLGSWSSSP